MNKDRAGSDRENTIYRVRQATGAERCEVLVALSRHAWDAPATIDYLRRKATERKP